MPDDTTPQPKYNLDEIDLEKVDSVTLRRLIEEVRMGVPSAFGGYDRIYNRHNR